MLRYEAETSYNRPFYNCAILAQGANTATKGTVTMSVSPFCSSRVPGFLAAAALSRTAAATSGTVLAQPFAKVPLRVFPGLPEGPAEHSSWQVNIKFRLLPTASHIVTIQQFKFSFIGLELGGVRLPLIIRIES